MIVVRSDEALWVVGRPIKTVMASAIWLVPTNLNGVGAETIRNQKTPYTPPTRFPFILATVVVTRVQTSPRGNACPLDKIHEVAREEFWVKDIGENVVPFLVIRNEKDLHTKQSQIIFCYFSSTCDFCKLLL
jgi:hypothetical protein